MQHQVQTLVKEAVDIGTGWESEALCMVRCTLDKQILTQQSVSTLPGIQFSVEIISYIRIIIPLFMGNQYSTKGANPGLYGWELIPSTSDRKLYRNKATAEQVEGYKFLISDITEYGRQRQAYDIRYNSSTLVASKILIEDRQTDLCSTYYKGELFLQYISYRLGQIGQVPYPDVLHLYSQCFKGFGELYRFVGYFDVTQDLICINRQGQVKVWLNPSLEKVRPELSFGGLSTETEMVNRIIKIIDKNTNHSTLPENIASLLLQSNITTFGGAQMALSQIVARLRTYIPSRLKSVQKIGIKTNPIPPVIDNRQTVKPIRQPVIQSQPVILQHTQPVIREAIGSPALSARLVHPPAHQVLSSKLGSINESLKFQNSVTPLKAKGPTVISQTPSQVVATHASQGQHTKTTQNFPRTQPIGQIHQISQKGTGIQTPTYAEPHAYKYHSSVQHNTQSTPPPQQPKSYIHQTQPQTFSTSTPSSTSTAMGTQFQFKQPSRLKQKDVQKSMQTAVVRRQTAEEVTGTNPSMIKNRTVPNPHTSFPKDPPVQRQKELKNKTVEVQKLEKPNIQLQRPNEKRVQSVHQKYNPRTATPNLNTNINVSKTKEPIPPKQNRTISLQRIGSQANKPKLASHNKTQILKQKPVDQNQKVVPSSKPMQPTPRSAIKPYTSSHTEKSEQYKKVQTFPRKQVAAGSAPVRNQPAFSGIKHMNARTQPDNSRLPGTPTINLSAGSNISGNRYSKTVQQQRFQPALGDTQGCTSPQFLARIREVGDSYKSGRYGSQYSYQQKVVTQQLQNNTPSVTSSDFSKNQHTDEVLNAAKLFTQKLNLQNPYLSRETKQMKVSEDESHFQHYSASKFRQDMDEIQRKISSLNSQNAMMEKDISEILGKRAQAN